MTWLINMTMYTTITAIIILLIKNIFKNKMSAKWQYYIWAILLIRFMIPTLPQSDISIFNKMPKVNEVTVFQSIVNPVTKAKAVQLPKYVINGNIGTYKTKIMFPVEKAPVDYVLYIWAIAAILLFLYFAFVYVSFSRSIRKMKVCEDDNILNLLEACKKKVSVSADIKVVIGGDTPILKGIFKPIIIIQEGYTESEIRDIFIHELCHYKHYDICVIWIAAIMLCINWFNPIMWYSFFIMRKDMELSCDQRVLEITDNRKEYANLLLKTALRKNKFMLGTTSIQNGEKEVSKRIKYIAYFKKPKVYWSIIVLIIAIIAGIVCLTNAASHKETDTNVTKPKSQAELLFEHKKLYVGDAPNTMQAWNEMPAIKGIKLSASPLELLTKDEPYGMIVNYDIDSNNKVFKDGQIDTQQFYKNSAMLFSLISNLDYIHVKLHNQNNTYQLTYWRDNINKYFNTDVRNFAKNKKAFEEFFNKLKGLNLENKILIKDSPDAFNIYNADDQLTYLFKAKSYLVKKEELTQKVPDIMRYEYGIDIKSMKIKGTTALVDLAEHMAADLDKGSANAAYEVSVMYKSLLELKGIKAVKVLISGKEGVEGNHFSFKTPAVLGSDGKTEEERYFTEAPPLATPTAPPKSTSYDKTNLEDVVKHNKRKWKNY